MYLSIYTYLSKIKEGCFTEEAQIPTSRLNLSQAVYCVLASWRLLVARTKIIKDRIQANMRLGAQKKRKRSKQEVAVRTSSMMRTETASHWFSLKAMQPRVWNQSCPPTDELPEICCLPEHMDPVISLFPHLWSQISVKGYITAKIKLLLLLLIIIT